MKYFILCILITTGFSCYSQEKLTAYDSVVDIMKTEFNHMYDSTSDVVPKPKPVKKNANIFCNTPSSVPENMSPLVLVNGMPFKIDDLKLKPASDIAEVEIIEAGLKGSVIYGTRGSKGVILLTLSTSK